MPQDAPEKGIMGDIGEFRFLNEILLPMLNSEGKTKIGDDTSSILLPGTDVRLVVTADASPRPLIEDLSEDNPETRGWYSVLINASDLAAAGCKPLAFTSSVEAPENTSVDYLRRFFAGMTDACTVFGLENAGGNLREAPRFECHGTAFGVMSGGREPLSRSGAREGDSIVSIGQLGQFVTSYLHARRSGLQHVSRMDIERLTRPTAKLREMEILAEQGLATAASDNSDGILGAIWNIAEKSDVSALLELEDSMLGSELHQIAELEGLNPWNLAFFWGDWQVIVSIPSDCYDRFVNTAETDGIEFVRLGRFQRGRPSLSAQYHGQFHSVNLVRNENFTKGSYNKGIRSQVDYQLMSELFVPIS